MKKLPDGSKGTNVTIIYKIPPTVKKLKSFFCSKKIKKIKIFIIITFNKEIDGPTTIEIGMIKINIKEIFSIY